MLDEARRVIVTMSGKAFKAFGTKRASPAQECFAALGPLFIGRALLVWDWLTGVTPQPCL
eukprot:6457186-Amphidinium_carterae.2